MNWNQIQKKYPKAFRLMDRWAHVNELNDVYHDLLDIRSLYDFFDKQKIYGQVGKSMIDWHWTVSELYNTKATFCTRKKSDLKSRKSAEKALFTKCFEILEGRLK